MGKVGHREESVEYESEEERFRETLMGGFICKESPFSHKNPKFFSCHVGD
jgi:hypothetical protein